MSLDSVLMTIFKVTGALAISGLLFFVAINLWWHAFEKTKTAHMLRKFVKDNWPVLEEWYFKNYKESKKVENVRRWLLLR